MTNAADGADMAGSAAAGPPRLAASSSHTPPPGRQQRPRRKSLEQLEAKYKAMMRNMLMYQQLRRQTACGAMGMGMGMGGMGAGTSVKAESGTVGGQSETKPQKPPAHHHQGIHGIATPSPSVSPPTCGMNRPDTSLPKESQHQQHTPNQGHQNLTSSLRDHQQQQRERPPQKRLQSSNNGPKSAYDRREAGRGGRGGRHAQFGTRPMGAAMHLAYEELASMQQQQQQHQHHHNQQHQQVSSAPIPIPRPGTIQIPPPYLQQYMHHLSSHVHIHHQPLAPPLPTPPHLANNPYNPHGLPALPEPFGAYETARLDHHQQRPRQEHDVASYHQHGNVKEDLVLDCFGSNMADI
ncbi:hypothetical protein GGS20DRAFT_153632 [Poronia punctata]|nr:hypothetical protein GGS20DRAFT_153632 [Poronia punctata]